MAKGWKHTEATKKRMSKMRKGKNHPLWGTHCSAETKARIAAGRKGKPGPVHTEAFKRKMSRRMLGKKLSAKTKAKIGVCTSAWLKRQWENPEYRSKQTERSRAQATKLWKTAEYRKKISDGQLAHSRGPYKESTLEYSVVNWARAQGMLVFKTDANHGAGSPDRIFCVPGGKPFFIEFKRPDGKGSLGKLQIYVLEKLTKAGYDVGVFSNREKAINALKERIRRT